MDLLSSDNGDNFLTCVFWGGRGTLLGLSEELGIPAEDGSVGSLALLQCLLANSDWRCTS